jgi:hypothetical protein
MIAHHQLIAEYVEAHPEVSNAEAYDLTADAAWERMRDNMADLADAARTRAKDERR